MLKAISEPDVAELLKVYVQKQEGDKDKQKANLSDLNLEAHIHVSLQQPPSLHVGYFVPMLPHFVVLQPRF